MVKVIDIQSKLFPTTPWLCEVLVDDHRCGNGCGFSVEIDGRRYYICTVCLQKQNVRFS